MRVCKSLDDAIEWAEELGLNGPLGEELPDSEMWLGAPSDGEREAAASLLRGADRDAMSANAASWLGKLKTALHWLALFRMLLPNIIFFLPLLGPNRERNALHMETMFVRMGKFMRQHGSIQDGQHGTTVRSDHVSAVLGTIRAYRTIGARYSLRVSEAFSSFGRRVQKRWRGEDGPRLERKLCLGIRSVHFERLDVVGWDRCSEAGAYDHAIAHTCKAVCARGGEPGLVDGKQQSDWAPETGVTVADMAEWVAAKAGVNGGLPWMRAWWFPIKDSNNTHVKTPIPISKRSSAVTGTDPACPYDAIRILVRDQERTGTSQRVETSPVLPAPAYRKDPYYEICRRHR